jgi:maleate isomerase
VVRWSACSAPARPRAVGSASNARAERAATELADARRAVVATACLVAIMAQGPGYHCTAEDAIGDAMRAEGSDAPVVSSAGALLSGIAALSAKKVAIITPHPAAND